MCATYKCKSLITSSRILLYFIILGDSVTHGWFLERLWSWWLYLISIRGMYMVASSNSEKWRSLGVYNSSYSLFLLGHYRNDLKTESTLVIKYLDLPKGNPLVREKIRKQTSLKFCILSIWKHQIDQSLRIRPQRIYPQEAQPSTSNIQ